MRFLFVVAACVALPLKSWGQLPCPLPRDPVVGSEMACGGDEDGDGLEDRAEEALASCVAPVFRFDRSENARRPDEPHLLFNAYRTSPDVVRFHFSVLFEKDGGWVEGGLACWSSNSHPGDSETVVVDVLLREERGKWTGIPVRLDTGSEGGSVDLFGLKPVVYPSAGKHHMFSRPGVYSYDVRGPGSCDVPARGDGVVVSASRVDHVPNFTPGGHGVAPLVDGGRRWADACFAARRGILIPSKRLHTNSLDDFGYPGQVVEGGTSFLGGASPVSETIALDRDWTSDPDHDGLDEIDALLPGRTVTSRDPDPSGRRSANSRSLTVILGKHSKNVVKWSHKQ
jgi:hypothetical protein